MGWWEKWAVFRISEQVKLRPNNYLMKDYTIKVFNGENYSEAHLTFFGKTVSTLHLKADGIDITAEDEFPFIALTKISVGS